MSDCEWFTQITQDKWATVSELLRSLMSKEQLWANRLGRSWQMSNREWIAQVAHEKRQIVGSTPLLTGKKSAAPCWPSQRPAVNRQAVSSTSPVNVHNSCGIRTLVEAIFGTTGKVSTLRSDEHHNRSPNLQVWLFYYWISSKFFFFLILIRPPINCKRIKYCCI